MTIETFEQHLTSDGWCKDLSIFKEILNAFPKNEVLFLIRNFSDPERLPTIMMTVKGLGWDRVYFNNANIAELFPQLTDWTQEHQNSGQHIPAAEFIDNGVELATLLRRDFKISHQFGSGRQEEASGKSYGPFKPV